ncbi:hypothetical protein RFI_22072, partial [Reticulomyxa filosa]
SHFQFLLLLLEKIVHPHTSLNFYLNYLFLLITIPYSTNKEPLNPYSMTLKQGLQHLQDQLKIRQQSINGEDKLIMFKCNFDECKPQIQSNMNKNVLLNDIYKHLPYYPNIQIHWKIDFMFMVSYKHTISTQRAEIPKSNSNEDAIIPPNQKSTFNPLLYKCDIHQLKIFLNKTCLTKEKSDNNLKLLLHEILYHDGIHKKMGYPLELHHICAVLLYCGKSCNVQFSSDQIQFRYHKWPFLDSYLQNAITILHRYERREEESIELYCGLKNVRLKNINEIKEGFFVSHVSTSDDIQVAQMYRSHQGCILHFHPSMRRTFGIDSCDVSWISPFKHEREILFSRSQAAQFYEIERKEFTAWNAKIEKEDENTQMILLTWPQYDKFLEQTKQIIRWDYSIDLNIIYWALLYSHGDINPTIKWLSLFQEWRNQPSNKIKYERRKNQFIKRRCCNHDFNLFSVFLSEFGIQRCCVEFATIATVIQGLPFVDKDKEMVNKKQ